MSVIKKDNKDGIDRKIRHENKSDKWTGDEIDEKVDKHM